MENKRWSQTQTKPIVLEHNTITDAKLRSLRVFKPNVYPKEPTVRDKLEHAPGTHRGKQTQHACAALTGHCVFRHVRLYTIFLVTKTNL